MPMKTIFCPASDQCRPRPQATGCVLSDQTVVVKWTWLSREAHIKLARQEAEQSRPRYLQYDGEIDNLIPEFTVTAHDGRERRALRMIVEQELQPLTKSTDPDELAVAFRKIVECHHWLYDTVKILHRDITLSSLMFQRIDDTLYGILCDFDAAEFHHRDLQGLSAWQPASKQHTGTGPYLAADLLVSPPPKHLYRHDLESFFYILVFLTCKIEGSKLASWKELGMATLKYFKESAITDGFPPQKNELAKFYGWVARLQIMFRAGCTNRTTHQSAVWMAQIGGPEPAAFDDVTLGGAVTFDTFAAIIVLENLQEQEDNEQDEKDL
ncbi:hypothetical protein DFH06DRAFT_1316194 [Mycena polygramma]|nr:hypothetical protein DFH06DRAFT_1316194 [Mycena polygramma]